MSKRVVAAAKAAKLKVEMKYLGHETNLRRIQLEREIALADAEEEAIKLVRNEEGISHTMGYTIRRSQPRFASFSTVPQSSRKSL